MKLNKGKASFLYPQTNDTQSTKNTKESLMTLEFLKVKLEIGSYKRTTMQYFMQIDYYYY